MKDGNCAECGKRYSWMELVEMTELVGWDENNKPVIERRSTCVYCIKAEAATRELLPDWDNLTICPRCGDQEILVTWGICGSCSAEVWAYKHG